MENKSKNYWTFLKIRLGVMWEQILYWIFPEGKLTSAFKSGYQLLIWIITRMVPIISLGFLARIGYAHLAEEDIATYTVMIVISGAVFMIAILVSFERSNFLLWLSGEEKVDLLLSEKGELNVSLEMRTMNEKPRVVVTNNYPRDEVLNCYLVVRSVELEKSYEEPQVKLHNLIGELLPWPNLGTTGIIWYETYISIRPRVRREALFAEVVPDRETRTQIIRN